VIHFKMPDCPEYLFDAAYRGVLLPVSCVELSTKKIDNHFKAKDKVSGKIMGYVGPEGSDYNVERNKNLERYIRSNSVEMPIMDAPDYRNNDRFVNSVSIKDGRHRLFVMCEMGIAVCKVVVPTIKKDLFLSAFG